MNESVNRPKLDMKNVIKEDHVNAYQYRNASILRKSEKYFTHYRKCH